MRKDRKSRLQSDLVSVKALAEFLRSVAAQPAKHAKNVALASALGSQGGTASFSDPDNGIVPMSLNHQKKVATSIYGDWKELDGLRIRAREALTGLNAKTREAPRGSKESLISKNQELELEANLLKQDLLILQRAYDLRCIQARQYAAAAGAATVSLCDREQREIEASFSLRSVELPPSNVVDLEEKRRGR